MGTIAVIILGLILAIGAGFALFLLVGPFIAGRWEKPPERQIDRRHRPPPEKRPHRARP